MDGKLKRKYSLEQSGEYFLCFYSTAQDVYAKIISMNEGEDPKAPDTSDAPMNDSEQGSDGVFSISHDSPVEEPEEGNAAPVEDAEPQDIFAAEESEAAPASSEPEDSPMQPAAQNPLTSNPNPSGQSYAQRRSGGRRDFSNMNNQSAQSSQAPQFFNDAMIANTPVEQPRQSKKGLIIAVGIGVLVLVLVGAFAFFFLNKAKVDAEKQVVDGRNTKSLSGKVRKKFNVYANYILSGEEKEDEIPESKPLTSKIQSIYSSSDSTEVSLYTSKASELFDDFINSFKEEIKLTEVVKTYKKDFDATIYTLTTSPLSYDEIYDRYIQGGTSSAENYVDSILGDNIDSHLIKSRQKEHASVYIQELDLFNRASCIVNKEVVNSCVDAIKSAEKIELDNEFKDSYEVLQTAIEASRRNVVDNIWIVRASVLGEEKNED